MSKFKKGDKVVILQDKVPNFYSAKYYGYAGKVYTVTGFVAGNVTLSGVFQPFMPHWLAHAEEPADNPIPTQSQPQLEAGDSAYLSCGELVYIYSLEGKLIITKGEHCFRFVELDLKDVVSAYRGDEVIWEKSTEDEEEPDQINSLIDDMIEIIAHLIEEAEKNGKA